MSEVPTVSLQLYQGEDWSMTLAFSGSDAPASLAAWEAYLEIRENDKDQTLVVRCTTDEADGYITVLTDVEDPTFEVRIPKAVTRGIPVGIHLTDFFAVPDVEDTFPVFQGTVTVTERKTLEEGPP